jgi:hypothetical protein
VCADCRSAGKGLPLLCYEFEGFEKVSVLLYSEFKGVCSCFWSAMKVILGCL